MTSAAGDSLTRPSRFRPRRRGARGRGARTSGGLAPARVPETASTPGNVKVAGRTLPAAEQSRRCGRLSGAPSPSAPSAPGARGLPRRAAMAHRQGDGCLRLSPCVLTWYRTFSQLAFGGEKRRSVRAGPAGRVRLWPTPRERPRARGSSLPSRCRQPCGRRRVCQELPRSRGLAWGARERPSVGSWAVRCFGDPCFCSVSQEQPRSRGW